MITPRHAIDLLAVLEMGGLKPPDRITSNFAAAATLYADCLNDHGVTLAEAQRAVRDYLGEPDPGTYPKPWPDPGKLAARTPASRLAATLGSESDAATAWEDYQKRLRHLGPAGPSRDDTRRHLDPGDPYRNDAMFIASAATGGRKAWGVADVETELPHLARRWRTAYSEARKAQARESDAVRVMLTASSRPLIEAK